MGLSAVADLNQVANFPTRIPGCDSHSSALLDFFLLTLAFLLQWLSLHWKVQVVATNVSSNSKGDAQFRRIDYDYSLAGTVLVII